MKRLWLAYTHGTTNRKILRAAVIVALMTFLTYLASTGKELVVAWNFGTEDSLDAFLIAFLLPSFIINVIAGSFSAAFIPTYIKLREEGDHDTAKNLLSNIMTLSMGILAATTILIVAAAPFYLPLLAAGFNVEKLTLTRHLLYALSPVVIANGLATILGAVLNAGERFALAALVPAVMPVTAVIFLLSFGSVIGIFALAFGTVCGTVVQAIFLAIAVRRQGVSLNLRWRGFDTHTRQVLYQYAPMIAGAIMMSGTEIIDQAMAAMLEPGSVAALNYGSKIIALPLGLCVTAIGTAVIPYFSTMVARKDWPQITHTLKHNLLLIFILTLPLTLILIFVSEPLVKILLQRGMFKTEDARVVAHVLTMYALQIPFYVAGILLVRLISAMRKNHILMWGALINLVANISLNYVFMQKIGVSGIALSTSCVYLLSFLFLFYNWQRLR